MKYFPPSILCTGCKKVQNWRKMIDYDFCWSCIGVTNEEEAMSVRCIGSKIIEPENIKPEKPKKHTPRLTAQKKSVNIYNFNVFNIKNFKIKVSFFISLSLALGIFIYYFFKWNYVGKY